MSRDGGHALAVLGGGDGVGRSAQDWHPRVHQRANQVERRLSTEHRYHTQKAVPLVLDYVHDLFKCKRLEVKPVAQVVVGAYRFRVVVDDDGLDPGSAQFLHRMHR